MANAIPKNALAIMCSNIKVLSENMKALIPSCALTHHEAMQLIAPPEHIETLFRAAEVSSNDGLNKYIWFKLPLQLDGVETPKICFHFTSVAGASVPLMPRYVGWYEPATLGELGRRVEAHVTGCLQWQRMRELCNHVLNELNVNCADGFQIRALWPVVQHLCSRHSAYGDESNAQLMKWHEKHNRMKLGRYMPRIDPEFRKILQETSIWLTQAQLLGSDLPKGIPSHVTIFCESGYPFNTVDMAGDEVTITRV